ncbi:hypothetical protein BGZ76_003135 [Entomortierella beljakovae]|nr:hypothetical protein BGZ76_003135 [Entomortierella beljakovae]
MSVVQEYTQPLVDFVAPISFWPLNIGVQITAIALPCLLIAETFQSPLGRYIFKPLASFGFLFAALSYIPTNDATFAASSTSAMTTFTNCSQFSGAIPSIESLITLISAYVSELKHIVFNITPSVISNTSTVFAHTTYTKAMMGAFVLGWIGDVLLMFQSGFLAGLGSFLAGHAAFMIAFTFHGQDSVSQQKGAGVVIAIAVIVIPWLLPKIKNKIMRGAVIAYMLVISGMVITAFGSLKSNEEFLPERLVGAIMFFLSDLFVARQQFVHKTVLNRWIGLPLYYIGQLLLASTLRGQHVLASS